MIGQEDKRTNNRTMIPALKNNAAAGYKGAFDRCRSIGFFRCKKAGGGGGGPYCPSWDDDPSQGYHQHRSCVPSLLLMLCFASSYILMHLTRCQSADF